MTNGLSLFTLLLTGVEPCYIPSLVDQYLKRPFDFMVDKGVTTLPPNHIFIVRENDTQKMIAISTYRQFETQLRSDKYFFKFLQKNIEKDRSMESSWVLTLLATFSIALWGLQNSTLPLLLSERFPQATILPINPNVEDNNYYEHYINTTQSQHDYQNIYFLNSKLNPTTVYYIYDSPELFRYQVCLLLLDAISTSSTSTRLSQTSSPWSWVIVTTCSLSH